MIEKRGGDRLCVWMVLCRDTVLQKLPDTNNRVLKKFIDRELLLNIPKTGISKYVLSTNKTGNIHIR
jgi:hypothetical protein